VKLEREIEIESSADEAGRRARAFLTAVGYDQELAGAELRFRRGSVAGSLASFAPRKWGSRAVVRTRAGGREGHTMVTLAVDVTTFGQVVTKKDRAYWKAEFDAWEAAVGTGTVEGERALAESHDAMVRRAWIKMGTFTGVCIGVAGPLGYALGLTQLASPVPIAVGVAAAMAAILVLAIWR
jgi:hypothetical protein